MQAISSPNPTASTRQFKFVGGPSRKRRRNRPRVPNNEQDKDSSRRYKTVFTVDLQNVATPSGSSSIHKQKNNSNNNDNDNNNKPDTPPVATSCSLPSPLFDCLSVPSFADCAFDGVTVETGNNGEDGANALSSTTALFGGFPSLDCLPSPPPPPHPLSNDFDPAVWPTTTTTTTTDYMAQYLSGDLTAALDPSLSDDVADLSTTAQTLPNLASVDSSDLPIFGPIEPSSPVVPQEIGNAEEEAAQSSPSVDATTPPELAIVPSNAKNKQPLLFDFGQSQPLYSQPSALYDTISRIFLRYDQEFCILPITNDTRCNPFRHNYERVQSFNLLRHSILALSYKHVNFDTGGACAREAAAYRRRALQMLKSETPPHSEPDVSLLDVSIVLFTLDCATSAFGPWTSHIDRVERILRSVTLSSLSAQRRAQVALFVWFDVALALTNRRSMRFPPSVARDLFRADHAADDQMDFFAVSGCPTSLFRYMIRLATYAEELRIAESMTCVRFDVAPVLRLRRELLAWKSPTFAPVSETAILLDDFNEENDENDEDENENENDDTNNDAMNDEHDNENERIQQQMDLFHCAESWRYALLLYIERVFLWQTQTQQHKDVDVEDIDDLDGNQSNNTNDPPSSPQRKRRLAQTHRRLQYLARCVMTHISACRATTFVQKQLLMPVFLAATETFDEGLRENARQFCARWAARTRYNMFVTASALLEEFWAEADSKEVDNWWWGEALDQKATKVGKGGKEYNFG